MYAGWRDGRRLPPQVPLKLFGLPGRYATALYVAGTKTNSLPTVEKELAAVRWHGGRGAGRGVARPGSTGRGRRGGR